MSVSKTLALPTCTPIQYLILESLEGQILTASKSIKNHIRERAEEISDSRVSHTLKRMVLRGWVSKESRGSFLITVEGKREFLRAYNLYHS